MERRLLSPAVLMTAYLVIFWFVGPWFSPHASPHRNTGQVVVTVLLAALAAYGNRVARMALIACAAAGLFDQLFGHSTQMAPLPLPDRLWHLVLSLAQICLLVSTPMYQRTRPGRSPGRIPAEPFLPAPRWWAVLAAVVIGFGITQLPLRGLRPVGCPSGDAFAPVPQCLADGAGYPVPFRYLDGILTIHNGVVHWLFVVAPRGINVAALATDWVLWSAGVLAVLYLSGLAHDRGKVDPAGDLRPGLAS